VCFLVRPDCTVEDLEACLLCFRGHGPNCNDLKGIIEGSFTEVVHYIPSPSFVSRGSANTVIKNFPRLLPVDAAELIILVEKCLSCCNGRGVSWPPWQPGIPDVPTEPAELVMDIWVMCPEGVKKLWMVLLRSVDCPGPQTAATRNRDQVCPSLAAPPQ
jgi:hypothetical protein